jgi:hypothetical protein
MEAYRVYGVEGLYRRVTCLEGMVVSTPQNLIGLHRLLQEYTQFSIQM